MGAARKNKRRSVSIGRLHSVGFGFAHSGGEPEIAGLLFSLPPCKSEIIMLNAPPPVQDYYLNNLWTGGNNLYDLLEGYGGHQIRMSDNATGEAHVFNIPDDARGRADVIDEIMNSHYFGLASPYEIDGNFRIQILNNPVGQPMQDQVFANDASMDCMTKVITRFTKNYRDGKLLTLTNAESIKKAKQPYRNALIYAAKFSNGVPEAELDAYSKAVKINITIKTYGDKDEPRRSVEV